MLNSKGYARHTVRNDFIITAILLCLVLTPCNLIYKRIVSIVSGFSRDQLVTFALEKEQIVKKKKKKAHHYYAISTALEIRKLE